MAYELKLLEQLIKSELNPLTLKREDCSEQFLTESILIAKAEKIRISECFKLKVYSDQKQKTLESYYRTHQVMLVQLADQVFHYLEPGRQESIYKLTNDQGVINLYKELMQIPAALLDFIEQYLPEYYDDGGKVPEIKRQHLAPEIKRKLNGIKKSLMKQNIYQGLVEIISGSIEQILVPGQKTSHRELKYIQKLQAGLMSFTEKKGRSNKDGTLCKFLMQFNFNSIRFFNYYIELLQERSRLFATLPELMEFYLQELKIVNQLPAEPGLSFKPELPAAREQVGSWICEELAFLEKKRSLTRIHPSSSEPLQNEMVKVHTSFSVAQLALAAKLLIDAKVITNKNAAELMRIVAASFKTDRQEVISEESLRNKSYSFESATVNSVKDVVIELLNLVKGY